MLCLVGALRGSSAPPLQLGSTQGLRPASPSPLAVLLQSNPLSHTRGFSILLQRHFLSPELPSQRVCSSHCLQGPDVVCPVEWLLAAHHSEPELSGATHNLVTYWASWHLLSWHRWPALSLLYGRLLTATPLPSPKFPLVSLETSIFFSSPFGSPPLGK